MNKNEYNYSRRLVINSYSDIPIHIDHWKIHKEEPMRVDTYYNGAYYCMVFGDDGPYVEIFDQDQYGQLNELVETVMLPNYYKDNTNNDDGEEIY